MESNKNNSIIFFLGAGASVKAGVPDTYTFTKQFRDWLKTEDVQKWETLEKIIEIVKKYRKEPEIDIELLLELLTKLTTKDQELLTKFYENGKFLLENYSDKRPIILDLKKFIKLKTIVSSEEKVKYLQTLLDFDFPLDIISVNYDTCIELLCNSYNVKYQDGFDTHWNPKVFDENTDIRLYKLHGSVMWYKSDKGGYVKSSVMEKDIKSQLMTGETIENLMLYPAQKWEFIEEPFFELLTRVKHLLESETLEFLVVAGYSFRDNPIRQMLWDVAAKNKNLKVILVAPNAYSIYLEKLRHYDNLIESSLKGRVICLPYIFEEILPHLRNYCLKDLKNAVNYMSFCQKGEKENDKNISWISCLNSSLNAEYMEQAELILKEKISSADFDRTEDLSISLYFKIYLISLILQKEGWQEYYMKFFSLLKKIFIERIQIRFNSYLGENDSMINMIFNWHPTNGGGYTFIGQETLTKIMDELLVFLEQKTRKISIDTYKKLNSQIKKTQDLINNIKNYLKDIHLENINSENIPVAKYLALRENKVLKQKEFLEKCEIHREYVALEHRRTTKGEPLISHAEDIKKIKEELELVIKGIESKILQNIIKE
ncbi:MAG: SIR2 family protein [bacterium]|nr:SIR2 family protein [bacterium]